MLKDLENNTVAGYTVAPVLAVTASDVDGETVDLLGYEGVTFHAHIGAEGDDTLSGSVYFEVKVEDSADDSTWADAADADVTNTVTSISGDTGVFMLADLAGDCEDTYTATYTGSERYVRATLLSAGTHTNGTPIAVGYVKWGAKTNPAA